MAHFLWDRQFISADTAGDGTTYPPGSFPRYSPVSGVGGAAPQQLGCCEQLDQEGFAILLAWMTGLTENATYQKIKVTADHVRDGPQHDRTLGGADGTVAFVNRRGNRWLSLRQRTLPASTAIPPVPPVGNRRQMLGSRGSPIGRTQPTGFGAATTTMSASTRRRTLMMTISSTSKRASSLPATWQILGFWISSGWA